jgi:hypothetical protein
MEENPLGHGGLIERNPAAPSARASDAALATSLRVEGIGGVGEGNRTHDLQNHKPKKG